MLPPAKNFASHATVAESFATEHHFLKGTGTAHAIVKFRGAARVFALDLTQDAG